MPDDLSIVVTGGSSGLGRAIVERFSKSNPDHYIFNLSKDVDDSCESRGQVWDVRCDVTSSDDIYRARRFIQEMVGGLDVLINCAGINYLCPFPALEFERWDRVMDTNVKGMFLTGQAFLNQLEANGGTILNIISNASHIPMRHSAVYNASKGAAHILTLQMARELTKPYGITVFGISPAKIAGTGMSQYIEETVTGLRGWSPSEASKYQADSLVTGKEIAPETLAEFIHWLLSEKSRHFHLSGCVVPYGA